MIGPISDIQGPSAEARTVESDGFDLVDVILRQALVDLVAEIQVVVDSSRKLSSAETHGTIVFRLELDTITLPNSETFSDFPGQRQSSIGS